VPSLLRVVLFLLTVSSFVFGAAPPGYSIRPVGIGNGDITPTFLTPTALSAGTSQFYDSANNLIQTVWVDDGSTSHAAGLAGPDYIGPDGEAFSNVLGLNDSGFAIGYSLQYGLNSKARAAWFYNPSTFTTVPLGYTTDAFTASNGSHSAIVKFLDAAGRAYGYSVRYEPGTTTSRGNVPWVYHPADGTLTPFGYAGTPGAFDPDSTTTSDLIAANRAGHVVGTTAISEDPTLRNYAWRYDGNSGTTIPLGFYDAQHTSLAGDFASYPQVLNDNGLVGGVSFRYNSSATNGLSAWLYDPLTSITTRVGLRDTAHTARSGSQESRVLLLNNDGQAAGISQQYTGFNQFPNAWLYDGHTTIPLGLLDARHTSPDGGQYSTPVHLDSAGRVAGYSARYQPDIGNTTVPSGQSAWLYTPGAGTVLIGLEGPGFTSNAATSYNDVTHLRDAGPVAGISQRFNVGPTYNSDDYAGWTPWVYDPATNTTTPAGLSGGLYTSAYHNLQIASLTSLNDAGEAIGYNWQVDANGSIRGKSAWFYDPNSHSTIPLVFSTRPDGYSWSDPFALTPDGFVFGSYYLYTSGSSDFTAHVFRWSAADGMSDLGSLLSPPGLADNGWFSLNSLSVGLPDASLLAGSGIHLAPDTGPRGFLLTPAVPEPFSLGALTALCLLSRRRK
jgi:hypothetical protein